MPTALLTLAQVGAGGIPGFVVWAIIIVAVIGIGLVVLRASGITVPAWVAQIGWIVIIAVVAILAIRFLVQLAGIL